MKSSVIDLHPEMDDSFNEQMEFDREWFDGNPEYTAMLRRPFEIESSAFKMIAGREAKLVLVFEVAPGYRQKQIWETGEPFYFDNVNYTLADDVYETLDEPAPHRWNELTADIQCTIKNLRKALGLKGRDRKSKKGFG